MDKYINAIKNTRRFSILTILIMMLIFSSCKKHSQATQDLHDDHSHESVLLTAYNNEFELFAEYTPFIKGEKSKILAHFTHLSDFKPLDSAEVSISLLVGEKGIRQTLTQAVRKGIYQFELQAVESGKATLVFDIKVGNESNRMVINNLEVYENDHAAEEHHIPEQNTVNGIVFTKEQSWKIDFKTDKTKRLNIGDVIRTTGVIISNPVNSHVLNAGGSGVVSMPENLMPGSKIKRGELLFSISGNNLAENNSTVRFLEAQNNFEQARTNLKRKELLKDDKIISEKEFLDAVSSFKKAETVYENLKTNFNQQGEKIISPMDGYMEKVFTSNGIFVEAGTPLALLTNNKKLILQADVASKYVITNKLIENVRLKQNADNVSFSISELNGKLLSVGQSTNDNNYMIPVSFELDNTKNLIPGQLFELWIETKGEETTVAVPNSALLEEQGNYFVMVQVHPEFFEKRLVKTGVSNGEYTAIKASLNEGERIVTRGALMIKLAQSSGALDPHAGHAH